MIQIRPMQESDLPEVLRIENLVFSCPWPPEAFAEFDFAEPYVICEDKTLVGYIMYHNVVDESVIINLAVDPAFQRRGYAEALLKQTLEQLISRGYQRFFLDVRVSNTAAQNLYSKYGFHRVGLRKNYYNKPDEDAILMVKTLTKEEN